MDWAKSSGVKQFLYISSAGIYKPTDEPPHIEGVSILDVYFSSLFEFKSLTLYRMLSKLMLVMLE